GKYVIGVGIRESSSDLLIQNCDEYYSYNELAGLTKESDVTHERHDPWELVIEAVKQMTAHSDVMRSDRLKQVMQEIDPAFNEKDLGFSRFSKFVVEAAHKGLIALTKRAIGRLGGESRPVSAQELGAAMAEIKGDEEPVEPAQVQQLLRQAHDRELIDLAKEDDGAYTVKLRDATPSPETMHAEPAA